MSEAFKTDTATIDGVTIRIEYFYDDTYRGKPWEEYDGNVNIYSKGYRGRYGPVEKKPSEIILKTNGDTVWAYDLREALKTARDEGWCTGCDWAQGLTKKQTALKAVQQNVEFWRGWLNDDWHYVGAVCTVLDSEGEETDNTESCWGFESLNDYHTEAAQEMAQGLADMVNREKREAWRTALREARERKYWACRDIATVNYSGVWL